MWIWEKMYLQHAKEMLENAHQMGKIFYKQWNAVYAINVAISDGVEKKKYKKCIYIGLAVDEKML